MQAEGWLAARDTESGEVPSQAHSVEQVPARQAGSSGWWLPECPFRWHEPFAMSLQQVQAVSDAVAAWMAGAAIPNANTARRTIATQFRIRAEEMKPPRRQNAEARDNGCMNA